MVPAMPLALLRASAAAMLAAIAALGLKSSCAGERAVGKDAATGDGLGTGALKMLRLLLADERP